MSSVASLGRLYCMPNVKIYNGNLLYCLQISNGAQPVHQEAVDVGVRRYPQIFCSAKTRVDFRTQGVRFYSVYGEWRTPHGVRGHEN